MRSLLLSSVTFTTILPLHLTTIMSCPCLSPFHTLSLFLHGHATHQQISSAWKSPPSMSIWTACWTSSGWGRRAGASWPWLTLRRGNASPRRSRRAPRCDPRGQPAGSLALPSSPTFSRHPGFHRPPLTRVYLHHQSWTPDPTQTHVNTFGNQNTATSSHRHVDPVWNNIYRRAITQTRNERLSECADFCVPRILVVFFYCN